jgi:hypothetical protein
MLLGVVTMMKAVLGTWALLGLVLVGGCGETEEGPRFGGRVVSHVDTYGSGTGSDAELGMEGSMSSGFEYGGASKPDWTSDIKWRFVGRDGDSDVYRLDWTFRPKGGTGVSDTKEVSFDGAESVKVFGNQWQVISLEPGAMMENSKQGT